MWTHTKKFLRLKMMVLPNEERSKLRLRKLAHLSVRVSYVFSRKLSLRTRTGVGLFSKRRLSNMNQQALGGVSHSPLCATYRPLCFHSLRVFRSAGARVVASGVYWATELIAGCTRKREELAKDGDIIRSYEAAFERYRALYEPSWERDW